MAVSATSLPFREQNEFLRRKLNLPTNGWTDVYGRENDYAFVVAGANRNDLVADFHQAVQRAIEGGTTLEAYPVVCGGMLTGAAATRFSEATHSMPYKGNRFGLGLRSNDAWIQPQAYPWSNTWIAGTGASATSPNLRETDNIYHLLPIELHDAANIWGSLDGIFYITGFNNAVENTLVIDGDDYVVIQDVSRTGHTDYYAMRLDD
ncbi:hypothetical protein L1F06_000765 [Ectopseudomonas hydrolytica]|uniref:Uncharacterized protein n=1 Tax=Ectopseudomonas hydrolytica TaxID=2493633 RepID=A0ABY5A807_9GAMM|nr:hypothetical protein [Pseudomonas hydrolytica]USR40000.1 hypothetical protein L1F06_000765 [Pseudomonas hydrolytica]